MTTLVASLATLPGRCTSCGFHVRTQGCRCPDGEWITFVSALRAAAVDGVIHQSAVRPLIRGRIEAKHIGQLYRRARTEGLLREVDHERSDDAAGRNSHRLEPVYRLVASS